jgi:hypothetical protein
MSTENPKVLASLKKYLKPNALKDTVKDTFVAYLGKNSTEADYEAFLEYVDSEYLTNECHKLNDAAAAKIGVYSLLDAMPNSSKGRPPSLNSVLDEQAYQDGNTATYDYYLGDRRTREEEQEFRQRLAFIKDIFDMLLDETKAQAVAEYMLGPLKDDDSSESDQHSEEEEEEDDSESSEEEEEEEKYNDSEPSEEEEEEEDNHKHRSSGHKHSHSHRDYDDGGRRRQPQVSSSSSSNTRNRGRESTHGRH